MQDLPWGETVENRTHEDFARLGKTEIEVFRWAAQNGHLDVDGAARDLALDVEEVQQAAASLGARHLLRPLPGDAARERLVPVAPESAAAIMFTTAEAELRGRLARIDELKGDFDVLGSLYAETQRSRRRHTPIQEVHGLESATELLENAISACQVEVLTCERGRDLPPGRKEQANERDLALARRGVQMRTLYRHSSRHEAATQDYVSHLASSGGEVRTLPELFGRLVVVDRKVAFIPRADEHEGVVVVQDPATVSYLCAVFDHSWVQATPLNPGHFGTPVIKTEAAQAIVRLLTEGMKDEMIARRLGMSLRTCRKHIADVMESFRAESRFQLGYLIRARLGDPKRSKAGTIDVVVAAALSSDDSDQ
ncbi:LuxR C-terminal-related transcriptional regulator [Streptomyces sp. NPDC093795]|uniref:LuxR C-terminal-related transcriptional regulator n=1 Tax=Streptomyces sp. NPDC093795 TaxID=3366051 RepID=UPI003817D866